MPSWVQQAAAFSVGCVVLVALFAAAIMGWVGADHAGLIVRLCIAVAGAGFTAFLLGYLHLDLPMGIKAGGPIGIFVLLWLINPGKEIQRTVSVALQRCKENAQKEMYDVAAGYCQRAAAELPDDYEPLVWLGQAQFYRAKYPLAIQAWEKALGLGADKAPINYSIGLAYLALKKFNDVRQVAAVAAGATTDQSMLARIWYLDADASKGLWDFGQGPDAAFSDAVEKYEAFLDIGEPHYRARAELACLYAKKGALTADAAQKEAYDEKAVGFFTAAIGDINSYSAPEKAELEKNAFAKAYKAGGADPCAAVLSALWERAKPEQDYNAMVLAVAD